MTAKAAIQAFYGTSLSVPTINGLVQKYLMNVRKWQVQKKAPAQGCPPPLGDLQGRRSGLQRLRTLIVNKLNCSCRPEADIDQSFSAMLVDDFLRFTSS